MNRVCSTQLIYRRDLAFTNTNSPNFKLLNLYISDDDTLLEKLHANGRDKVSVRIPFQPLQVVNGAVIFDSDPQQIAPIPIQDIGLHRDPAVERIKQNLGIRGRVQAKEKSP